MKPLYFDRIEEGAMNVNKIPMETLKEAPDQKAVWLKFVDWVNGFNKKKSAKFAPIAGGKNIRHFDMKFVAALNKLHCPKKEDTILFNNRTMLDLEDFLWHWFSGNNELENYKMDTVRAKFGMSTDGVHNAICDTEQTGTMIMKFLKLYRNLFDKVSWK